MQQDPWIKQKKLHSSAPAKEAAIPPKRKWRLLSILWLAFKKTSMVIGAFVILGSVASTWLLSSYVDEIDESFPDQMVLHMKLEGSLGDLPKDSGFVDPFVQDHKTIKNYIDAIDKARTDPRVEGIYAYLGNVQLSVAHIQELRQALHNFKESGKFTYIYAPSYDQGVGGYYLASAFDEIWMQPMGVVLISGLNAEMPYMRDVLDKIGIEPQIYKRKEYKGAYDMFTESHMPEASRRATQALVTDIAEVLKADIAKRRGLAEDAFMSSVNKGLFIADEAVQAKLIDYADYEDKLIEKINKNITGDPDDDDLSYVKFMSYVKEMVKEQEEYESGASFGIGDDSGKPGIALIYAVGAIMDSDKGRSSISVDDGIAGADKISDALLDAADDENIDAVVLRVDSPGGSPVASETILRAVQKVQEEGKTVTVSMGPIAASGGYWIASLADEIFVLPTTITGSIGVLGGKFSLANLWQTLGVNWDHVRWGDNASMWSMNQPYTKSEAERVNAMMDNVYSNFIKRVAKGRDMTEDEVEKIAKGRVWSGKQAIEKGLADQFGGLNDALDYAAVQAGGLDRNDVNIVVLPKPLSAIEQLIELLETQASSGESLHVQAEFFKQILPSLKQIIMMQNMKSGSVYEPIRVQ